MSPKDAFNKIKYLAYRDGEYAVRIYIENRISRSRADQAYHEGMTLRNRHIETGEFPKIAHEGDHKKAMASLEPETAT